jgi:hypothetical protein
LVIQALASTASFYSLQVIPMPSDGGLHTFPRWLAKQQRMFDDKT